MKLKINPFENDNPMSWRDAAVVASLAAFATWILTFLVSATVGQIRADPVEFLFEAVKAYAAAWAGNFITLTGLAEYTKRSQKESEEPG